jgi:hypothetical protein
MVGIFVLDGVLDNLEARICLPKGLRRVLDDIGEVRLRHSGMFAMFGNVLKEYSGCSRRARAARALHQLVRGRGVDGPR